MTVFFWYRPLNVPKAEGLKIQSAQPFCEDSSRKIREKTRAGVGPAIIFKALRDWQFRSWSNLAPASAIHC